MSIAKDLALAVDEGRMTEDEADDILKLRETLWRGCEDDGQMLFRLSAKEAL